MKKTKTFFPVSQKEKQSLKKKVFSNVQLKPGLLLFQLILISLMLMLKHKYVIKGRMRRTKAIPALDTAGKELPVVELSVTTHCAERVFNFSPVPFDERNN